MKLYDYKLSKLSESELLALLNEDKDNKDSDSKTYHNPEQFERMKQLIYFYNCRLALRGNNKRLLV